MKAFIKGVSVYLPIKTLTNQDLTSEFPEWTVDKVTSKIGINQRHIASDNEFASDMAFNASKKLFEEYDINKNDIDFIILCTQNPDYFLPTTACIIQEKLGLPNSVGAFDFNQGCSGYLYGLSIAKGLIMAGVANNILFITSETYTKIIHPRDKGNRSIFGDAATASLISSSGFWEIKEFIFGTDGTGANNLILKNRGFRYPHLDNSETYNANGNIVCNDYLFMDGSSIFNFTLESVPKLVNSVLQKNNLDIDLVNYFIFHQANQFILEHLRKKIKIPVEKFIIDIKNTGNTVSSTIPIALRNNFFESKAVNEKILLAGFGVGYSWGGCILSS